MVVPAVKCPRCAVTLLLWVAPALMSADDALLAITKPPGTTGRRDKSPDPPAIDADNPDLSIAERRNTYRLGRRRRILSLPMQRC